MGDMLHEHVMKTRDAPSVSFAATNSFRTTFVENHSIIKKCADKQSISLSSADVNFNSCMQKCKELSVQPIPGARKNYCRTMETICAGHSAAAISMGTVQAEDGKIQPLFYSGCSTVLTSSMLNCRKNEDHVISIMQAESGVQMASTHKRRKTHYVKSRDSNIRAIESDALNVPFLNQDLSEGRTNTNDPNSQVILDKNTDIRGIYPRINSNCQQAVR